MIIPAAPINPKDCNIYKLLLEKSTEKDGCSEKAEAFLKVSIPMVDLISSGPFKEFTLHNRDHCKKVLHLMGQIVADEVIRNFSVVELLILIMAAYLHDMGMCITSVERARIVGAEEFHEYIRNWLELWSALENARTRLDMQKNDNGEQLVIEAEIYQLQEAAICGFLRPKHATPERYRTLISLLKKEARRNDLFEVGGVSFEDILIDVCVSHNEDAGVLTESKPPYDDRFPRDFPIGGQTVNSQFCASLLRIADIIDFDRERTPRILFESLGITSRTVPGADVTIQEWEKHMAVHTIQIDKDEIVVFADSHHPVIERSVRDFCRIIENELRNTTAIVKRNISTITSKYILELPLTVRPRIRSLGYVYKDMSFRLNQSAIISLLMGEKLYSSPAVPLRELVQNSIDACAARQKLEESKVYVPSIVITSTTDPAGHIWIQVADNGIGMDEHVLNEFFLNIGSSYYDSIEFEKLSRAAGSDSFVPISRFGIGIVSVFLIADVLEVHTCSAHSPRKDSVPRLIRIEKMGGLAFVRENEPIEPGTTIKIRLRSDIKSKFQDFVDSILSYFNSVIVRPKYDIKVKLLDKPHTFTRRDGIMVKANAEQYLDANNLELVVIELSRWSDILSGNVVLLFGYDSNSNMVLHNKGRKLVFGNKGVEPNLLVENYVGNVISVNGFRMTVKKGKILGGGVAKLAMLFDIDVTGDKRIVYDVSRDRIIGDGKTTLLRIFKETILKALEETGVLSRFSPSTHETIQALFHPTTTHVNPYSQKRIDKELLAQVKDLIPKDKWPVGVHGIIAEKLGVSRGIAYQAMNQLLKSGEIVKPVKDEMVTTPT